ncbi:MAG: hypothetical protein KDD48_07555 [Bdellovibrionales bacterium]|nr:hypothetical protein [Bdellovibrionales bacterium]
MKYLALSLAIGLSGVLHAQNVNKAQSNQTSTPCGLDQIYGQYIDPNDHIYSKASLDEVESRSLPLGVPEYFWRINLAADGSVPIVAHILREVSGSIVRYAIPKQRLFNQIDQLNEAFAHSDISFSLQESDIHYIDTSYSGFSFYRSPLSKYPIESKLDHLKALMREHSYRSSEQQNNFGKLNIYFISFEHPTSFCGYSSLPMDFDQGVIINTRQIFSMHDQSEVSQRYFGNAQECIGIEEPHVAMLAHEIGHFFGLLHTHHAEVWAASGLIDLKSREWVRRDGNCDVKGDGLCETPADYDLFEKVDANCDYTGAETDVWGENLKPNTHLFMSYAPAHCKNAFTKSQFLAMEDNLFRFRVFQDPEPESTIDKDINSLPSVNIFPNPVVRGNPIHVVIDFNEFIRNESLNKSVPLHSIVVSDPLGRRVYTSPLVDRDYRPIGNKIYYEIPTRDFEFFGEYWVQIHFQSNGPCWNGMSPYGRSDIDKECKRTVVKPIVVVSLK